MQVVVQGIINHQICQLIKIGSQEPMRCPSGCLSGLNGHHDLMDGAKYALALCLFCHVTVRHVWPAGTCIALSAKERDVPMPASLISLQTEDVLRNSWPLKCSHFDRCVAVF